MNDATLEPNNPQEDSRQSGAPSPAPQKQKRTSPAARNGGSGSVNQIRKRLLGHIDTIDGHLEELAGFCRAARTAPESCDPAAAKKAASGIQTVTSRAQEQLTKLSEARAQEQRRKLLDLGSILGDALNVDEALNAAANGADKDTVMRALLADGS